MPKNRNQSRNGDAEKLDYLQKNIKLPTIREKTLHNMRYTQKHHERTPDLIINGKVILEHDTYKIHGDLNEPNEKTKKRNIDHCMGDLPFFVIHEDLCKQLGLNEAKLAEYLYYHTLMTYNTYNEAKGMMMY